LGAEASLLSIEKVAIFSIQTQHPHSGLFYLSPRLNPVPA
jgi:hypothetical protein